MAERLYTHTDKHEALIEQVLVDYPGARRSGFAKAVRELWSELGGDPDDWMTPGFVPDAYLIDREAGRLAMFEVSVTHGLTDNKLTALAEWWAHWDDEDVHDWLPELIEIDRFGEARPIDLCRMFHVLCVVTPEYRLSAPAQSRAGGAA